MIKHVSDEEMKLAQLVKDLRMQVAALEVAMMELEDRDVVGECIRLIEQAVEHREPASTYADKIREHFGVTP